MHLHPARFDLMAKYLYIKFKEKNINTDFYKELYHQHIKTFNNCWEHPGTKVNIQQFFDAFDRLIQNMKKNGYDKNQPIPIGCNGIIINGAHRLVTAFFLKINSIFERKNEIGNSAYNYNFFLHRKANPALSRLYCDRMALEYTKINPSIRSIIIYPVATQLNKMNMLIKIIEEYGYLYYSKHCDLNRQGINNLIKEAYRGEKWIGGLFPQGWSPGGKAQRCVANAPTIICLVTMNDLSKCIELKERCRSLFGLGKHSLHISDYPTDTFRIASSLLNDNSIHYLNNGSNDITPQTKQLLANYFKEVGEKREDYCLTSSLILEMYHLRPARDIDYLHKDDKKLSLEKTGVHDGKWLTYYHKHKDEIIYNPTYHFYFNGFKFATLEVIRNFKKL